jgi:hypothetical protein
MIGKAELFRTSGGEASEAATLSATRRELSNEKSNSVVRS